MPKMSKETLLTIIRSELNSALGSQDGELSSSRAEAMRFYLAEKLGNEQEGRSQVVLADVRDTIEWMLPSLMRIFTSTDSAVEFTPVGPEDEEAAKQETDVINHVFYKENDGFLIFYSLFKDALLSKNGFVKIFWDESKKTTRETYSGLTDAQYTLLLTDPELEALSHDERIEVNQMTGMQELIHDVEFRRETKSGKAAVMNVPPEEILISKWSNSPNIKQVPFICHRSRKTASELIQLGFDEKTVLDLPAHNELDNDEEWLARRHIEEEQTDRTGDSMDPSMRRIVIEECFLHVDYDGDNEAELRKVTISGKTILDNEEIDSIPFASLTPIILTHKFFGLSVVDLIKHVQTIKTAIIRQVLDNLYLSNNGRWGVVEGQVNLDDLLTARPHGIVRMRQPGMVTRLDAPSFDPSALTLLDYFDIVKETGTGIGKQFQGLNADTLKDANIPAVNGLLNAAQQRVELIARIFSETGVKQIFLDLHKTLQQHQETSKVVRIRNQWVEVDPRQWRSRSDMTVNVGLGSSNRDVQTMNIRQIIEDQNALALSGGLNVLVNPTHIFQSRKRWVESMGFKSPEEFYQDPNLLPPAPEEPDPPDPATQAIQAQLQIETQKLQLEQQKMAMENERKQAELQLNIEKMLRDHLERMTELEAKYNVNVPGSAV